MLTNPRIWPIFFAGEDPDTVAAIGAFTSGLKTTRYWDAVVGEYGIGAAIGEVPIVLAEAAPEVFEASAIDAWLIAKLNADDAAFPALDDNTILALFFPAGTAITETRSDGSVATLCEGLAGGGYHTEVTLDAAHGNRSVATVVVPRCEALGAYHGLDALTAVASHEFIEAATDPYWSTAPAIAAVDLEHYAWAFALGFVEAADLCAIVPTHYGNQAATGVDAIVTRSWSNISSAAGHDPCVPAPAAPYFNALPVLPDRIDFGGPSTPGLKVPVGETRSIDLQLYSDRPMEEPFYIQAIDWTHMTGAGGELTVSVDPPVGQAGETVTLSVHKVSSGNDGAQVVALVPQSLDGRMSYYFVLVGN